MMSRWVPYVDERLPEDTRRFLPTGPVDELTVERVDEFVRHTRTARNTRLQVLAILRTHGSNGAETALALAALILAGLAIVVTVFATVSGFGTAVAVVYAILALAVCGVLTKPAVAAYARKMTAIVWLGAYEDGIRDDDTVVR